MNVGDGRASVLIRVLALDAEPGGGEVHGLAQIDIGLTETGVSLASPESWRSVTSAAVDLGSLADAGMLRDLVRDRPVPDAVAAFGSLAWDSLTPEVIGDIPPIDVRKVVRAAWPDLPPGLTADPVGLLASVGGTPAMAATVPQPDLTLAGVAEAAAMLLGMALISATVRWRPAHLAWFAAPSLYGPETGVRDRVATLVRLSARPLSPPPWPPGPWDDPGAWREVSGEELRRIVADHTESDESVANAKAELARRGAA